jgi:hypothetical protein
MRFIETSIRRCLFVAVVGVTFAGFCEARAHAAPPASAAPTRAELVAQIEAEQQKVYVAHQRGGPARSSDHDQRRAAIHPGEARQRALPEGRRGRERKGEPRRSARERARERRNRRPAAAVAAMANAITKGGTGAMALAVVVVMAIAETSADPTTKSDNANTTQQAADIAVGPPPPPGDRPLDVTAVRKLFDASRTKPGSVPIAFADIEPLKVTGAAATSYVLGVIRKAYRAYTTTTSQRSAALKLAIEASQQRIAALKAELAKRP